MVGPADNGPTQRPSGERTTMAPLEEHEGTPVSFQVGHASQGGHLEHTADGGAAWMSQSPGVVRRVAP